MRITFNFNSGHVEIDRPDLEELLLQLDANARHHATAEVQALMRVYKLGNLSEEDKQNPYIGLLRTRLGIGEDAARFLIESGELEAIICGPKKNYRVTEHAVRQHLGIPVPQLPDALAQLMHEVLNGTTLTISRGLRKAA